MFKWKMLVEAGRKKYDNCKKTFTENYLGIYTSYLAYNSLTQSKQSAKTYIDYSGRHLFKIIAKDISVLLTVFQFN